jgi:hypothetical protein
LPDLLQPRTRLLLRQARKLASHHDIVVVAREHQPVLLDLDHCDAPLARQHFDLRHQQQQFQRRGQLAETAAQLLLQAAQPGLVRRLRQLAINLDALSRVRDVAEVLNIEPDGGGGYFIGFSGVPGSAYRLQRARSLAGPWTTSAPQTTLTHHRHS